jgi:hypothetical protein
MDNPIRHSGAGHLAGTPVEAALVAFAQRTAPDNPITVAMARELMHVGGQP